MGVHSKSNFWRQTWHSTGKSHVTKHSLLTGQGWCSILSASLCHMGPFCRIRKGNYAQQSILTQNPVSFQTRPNLKKSKWSAQLLMLFCLFGDLIWKHPQHVEETEKSFLPVLHPWATKCFLREELQVLIQVHFLGMAHCNLQTFNPVLQSHTSYYQGLFRWKWRRACTGWAQAIPASFSKDGYVRCRPGYLARQVPNSKIMRCSESYRRNTSCCTVVSQKQLTTARSFARTLGHVFSSSFSKVSWGLLSPQTPAAIIPTPSLQLVSEHSWAEGIPSVIFLFPVQHPTKQALWMPLMTVSGIEGWVPNNFFPMTPTS